MGFKKTTRLLLALLMLCAVSLAQTYYVDANTTIAEADQDGSIGKPFNTVEDVQPYLNDWAFQSVYFKRGSTFTLSKSAVYPSNLYLGAYGTGERPIFTNAGTTADVASFWWRGPLIYNVFIENLISYRATECGFQFDGVTFDVTVYRCKAEETLGYQGFFHQYGTGSSSVESGGRIYWIECEAIRQTDGFSQFGNCRDVYIRCEARFCGHIWDTWEYLRPDVPKTITKNGTAGIGVRLRNIYVDSVNGSDSNGGLSPMDAKRTSFGVESIYAEGDIINVARGSVITDTIDPLAFQTITSYGTGPIPIFDVSGDGLAISDGNRDLYVEGIEFSGSTDGVGIDSGAAFDATFVDCYFIENSRGIRLDQSDASGRITIFRGRFYDNDSNGVYVEGDIDLTLIDSYVKGTNGATSSAVQIVDEADLVCIGSEFWLNRRAFDIDVVSDLQIIRHSFIHEGDVSVSNDIRHIYMQDNASATTPAPQLAVYNTCIHLPDPDASDIFSAAIYTEVANTVVANVSFYDGNDGTNSRESAGVRIADGGSLTLTNCAFDGFAGSSAYFIRDDTTASEFGGIIAAGTNYYVDPGSAPSRWRVPAGTRTFAQWQGTGTVADTIYSTDALYGEPGGVDEHADSFCISGDGATVAHAGGADLTSFEATFPGITEDLGRRERGLDGTWAIGAIEHETGSPDGYTNHDTAGMILIDCLAEWCEDGMHLTSSADMLEDEQAVIGCEFDNCYRFGLNVSGSSQTNWPTRDLVFRDCHISANGPDGDSHVWERCFAKAAHNSEKLWDLQSGGTQTFRNCVMVGPVVSPYSSWYAVTTASTLTVHNNALVFPTSINFQTTNFFGLYSSSSTLELLNSVFDGTDNDLNFWVRQTSSAGTTLADFNWYRDLDGSDDHWYTNSASPPNTWTEWQGYNKGTGAAASDVGGGHVEDPFIALFAPDDRLQPLSAYGVPEWAVPFQKGSNLSAQFRFDGAGAIRASTGVWNVGPVADPNVSVGVFRVGGEIVFADFVLDANVNENIRLTDRPLSSSDECVTVKIVGLRTEAAAEIGYRITEGRGYEGRVLHAGTTGDDVSEIKVTGSAGRNLFIHFDATSGNIYGKIAASIERVTPSPEPRKMAARVRKKTPASVK